MIIAGADIGNNTTEVALAGIKDNLLEFMSVGISATTGIKGTPDNVVGVKIAIEDAARKVGISFKDIDFIRINEATPVIADVAMETITETIITESTMIGHNPSTPGGTGLGTGTIVPVFNLDECITGEHIITIIPGNVDFEDAASFINRSLKKGINVNGAIVQRDDGVLIANRLVKNIPIVDEVSLIEKVPLGTKALVEVTDPGFTIKTLSNPYGIATAFGLNPDETKSIVPISRALIGNRSAVVIRTPLGDVKERRIPAGSLLVKGGHSKATVDIESGSGMIMEAVDRLWPLADVEGSAGSNVNGLLSRVRESMSIVTAQTMNDIKIQDILAVDTLVQQKVKGGLANEFFSEDAVALAAMVKSSRLPMEKVAKKICDELKIPVQIGGVEANMAILGALTTPGVTTPLAVLDLGGGSTDAAFISGENKINAVHLAGAGEMVNMLIAAELGVNDKSIVEDIKRYPAAKVESLFSIRLEDGKVKFYEEPLDPKVFARVVLLKEKELVPLPLDVNIEKVRMVRRKAKEKVFVKNALRALSKVAPAGNIRLIDFVVLVGGSALDFEIPEIISDALAEFGIVSGRGNIRSSEGPRNAVATGLVLSANKKT
jgi:diol dehydratase reactivase alpha subunit